MRHSASRRRHGRRKASAGIRRRLLLVPAILLSLVLGIPSGAVAYWTTTGAGSASGMTGTLAAPTGVSAAQQGQTSNASVAWLASPTTGVTGYRAERAPSNGTTWTTVCTTTGALVCTGTGIADGSYRFRVVALRGSWTAPSAAPYATATIDTMRPTVTINQATTQADPTNATPVLFTVRFSEPVTGFATGDVAVSGTATNPGTTAAVSGSGVEYTVAVNGLSSSATGGGTVIVSIPANVAIDGNGNGNFASTSTDNVVVYDTIAPAPATAAPDLQAGSDSGTLSTDNITNATALSFSGSASAASNGSIAHLYRVPTGGGSATLAGSATVIAGAYTIQNTTAPEGAFNYYVVLADLAGNVSAPSPNLQVVVDRSAPAPVITTITRNLLTIDVKVTAGAAPTGGGTVVVYGCAGIVNECRSNPISRSVGADGTAAASFLALLGNLGAPASAQAIHTDLAGNTSAYSLVGHLQ